MTPVTPFKRGGCIELSAAGHSARDISARLSLPLSTVYYTLKRHTQHQSSRDRPRSGRPSKLSPRTQRSIIRDIEADPRQPFSFFGRQHEVSASTIRRLAATRGLYRRIVRLKPFLTPRHRHTRKQWAIDNAGRDWRRVIFTDEASFELGKARRTWTSRRTGEELAEAHVAPLFRSGRQSVMVWGAIGHGKRFPLVFFEAGAIKSQTYVDKVIQGPLPRFVRQLARGWDDVLVVEDNAPIHQSNLSCAARAAEGIASLKHPSCSPDLNPIEHMWSIAKHLVSQMPKATNTAQLQDQIKQAWGAIPIEVVNRLIGTMEERRAEVQRNHGWHTRF